MLVESDWLDFGHKFGDRCGHQEKVEDQNEQCPVFLQWLDAVHQLLKQFPCLFEFNEAFLVRNVHANISLSLAGCEQRWGKAMIFHSVVAERKQKWNY